MVEQEPVTELSPFSGEGAVPGDAIRGGDVLVYRVVPSTAFGFGKGNQFSQTRWRFS